MLKWLLIALTACAICAVARLWPLLWAITSSNPVTRMKRMLVAAGRCHNNGNSRRAIELAGLGLWFAGEPHEATTPETRRLGSDLAAAQSFAYGRLNLFQFAQMMATNSVLRDRA